MIEKEKLHSKKHLGKRRTIEIIIKIDSMRKDELLKYAQEIYLSKDDIDKKSFSFIQRALDIKLMNLREETTLSPMAVISELRPGEV